MNFPAHLQTLWHGKRFNSFNRVLRDGFDARVYKIGLRLDFTCPNRDGTVAVGGCIYCNNSSHTPANYRPRMSVTEQLEQGAAVIRRRHHAERFIAYFQSYTNTYDTVDRLEQLYREALAFPGVIGLAVATRPDCLADETLELLARLARQTYLWLELGLESMRDRTLRWINRGHDLAQYIDAVQRAQARGLRICTHLILGFPGESRDEILETAVFFNRLGIDGVKLHNLHVLKNTVLEKYYLAGAVPLLSQEDYAALVVDFLERLNPEIVMHRLSAEAQRTITVAPAWSVDKRGMHNTIHRQLMRRDAWQGRLYTKPEIRTSLPSMCNEGAVL
jgi:radical SAM protein (TIGR01212 family)